MSHLIFGPAKPAPAEIVSERSPLDASPAANDPECNGTPPPSIEKTGSIRPRLEWPDAAKGVGIILVVIGHVIGGLIDSDISLESLPLREIFMGIYTFHMPLFFFLSGLFVHDRMSRDRQKFLRSIWSSLYFPYLLWSAVQFTVIFAAGRWTNTPPPAYWETLITIPFRPVSQFWFLIVLSVMHLITAALLPRTGVIGLIIAAVIMRSVGGIFMPQSILFSGTLAFYMFYAAGLALGPKGVDRLVRGPRSIGRDIIGSLLAVGIMIMAVEVLIMQTGPAHFYQEHPRMAAAAIAGVSWDEKGICAGFAMMAAIISWSDRLKGTFKSWLVFLGRSSLAIYILHVMFAAGTRIVLVKFLNFHDIRLILPLLVIVGVVGPLIVKAVLDQLRISHRIGLA